MPTPQCSHETKVQNYRKRIKKKKKRHSAKPKRPERDGNGTAVKQKRYKANAFLLLLFSSTDIVDAATTPQLKRRRNSGTGAARLWLP